MSEISLYCDKHGEQYMALGIVLAEPATTRRYCLHCLSEQLDALGVTDMRVVDYGDDAGRPN